MKVDQFMEIYAQFNSDLRAIKYVAKQLAVHGLYTDWVIYGRQVSVREVCFWYSFADVPAFSPLFYRLPKFIKSIQGRLGWLLFTIFGGWLIRMRQRALLTSACVSAMKRYPLAVPTIIREFSKFYNLKTTYEKVKR